MKKLAILFLLAFFSIAYADIEQIVNSNYILRSENNLCSATLISQEYRWVLTNQHCIESSVQFIEQEVVAPDGTVKKVRKVFYGEITLSQPAYGQGTRVGEVSLRAEILAFDKSKDLAVLRILSETTQLPKGAKIPPDDYKLRQGQTVFAVGNPIGLENTVTKGIINHLYREHKWSSDRVARYIQTDAAITGGSSGGALYDENDYLIGVPSAGYNGVALNFAIPYNEFKKFLKENGFERAWNPNAPTREEWLKKKEDKK